MTQRGRDHWTTLGQNSPNVYELTVRGSKRRRTFESSEEQASEADAAFIQESEYDGGKDSRGSDRAAPRFFHSNYLHSCSNLHSFDIVHQVRA